MIIDKYINRLIRIDQLIRLQCTGTPKELASKLEISESHVYNCIEDLRAFNLPIAYCRIRKTYYYTHHVQLKIDIGIIDLSKTEITEIEGGSEFNFFISTPI